MRYLFLFCFMGCLATSLSAQQFLQMERAGSFKTKRYYPGDQLTFKIKGDDFWYTEDIVEVLVDDKIILFTHRAISVDTISHIRSFKMRRWSKPMGQQFYNFGAGWLLFSLGDAIGRRGSLYRNALYVPLTAATLGFIIQKAFRQRTFRMGENRRLRLLDLSFGP